MLFISIPTPVFIGAIVLILIGVIAFFILKKIDNKNKEFFTKIVYFLMKEKMEDVVIECLEYFGNIKSIDYNEDSNAIELWFTYEEEPYVAYLFNYNEGVVLCQ